MPYHDYVFKEGKFLGNFEDMYKDEGNKNYDSWHQEDYQDFGKKIGQLILSDYNFNNVLDIGCGKGTFTRWLKKNNNYVKGVDISETVINLAKYRYKEIDFSNVSAEWVLEFDKKWDLIVMMEVMSYFKNWKDIIEKTSKKTTYLYVSLYIPQYIEPSGYVKSFNELRNEIKKYYTIENEIIWNSNDAIYILGKSKDKI